NLVNFILIFAKRDQSFSISIPLPVFIQVFPRESPMAAKRPLRLEELEDRLVLSPTLLGMYNLPTDRTWQTTPFVAAPIFADLDGTGHEELLVAAAGGRLLPLTFANGQINLWNNLTYDTSTVTGFTNRQIEGTPIVLNLPGGHKGIFAALGYDPNNAN